MLVQVAFVVFGLFAVLALVIDVGYARVTQTQMQVAADTAAIEGMRNRDVGVPNAAGVTVNDPFASDCIRRARTNRFVRWTFDDDFDTVSGDPDFQFGAGPVLDVDGGRTNLHALAGMSVPETHSYKPDLQLNQENAVHGDMVSGRFCYVDDPLPSESGAYADTLVCTEPQRATGNYARNDFNPNEASPAPPAGLPTCPLPDEDVPSPWPLGGTGSLGTVNDSAFLVRLRRSNENEGFPEQTEPTVASSGPALPLVFGRGALIHGDDPASTYSIRRDGVTVRASAIAQIRPALQVGLPQATPVRPGLTPFTLSDTFVNGLGAAPVQATINPLNGLLCRGTTCVGVVAATSIGRYVDNLAVPNRNEWLSISRVGLAIPAPAATPCPPSTAFAGFGPVYSQMGSGVNRIIGFTRITMVRDLARPLDPCGVLITRGASLVASANASAHLPDGLPLPVGVGEAEVAELMNKNLVRAGAGNYNPVFVAVLAR